MSKRIALFDLDTPIYKVASACEIRNIEVTHTPTLTKKIFKNRTEFKELLKSKDKIDSLSEYEIVDTQIAESLSIAIKVLDSNIENTLENIWADKVIYMVSGTSNFRNELALPSKYKGTRSTVRPLLLRALQSYAKGKYNAVQSDMEECDDMQVWMGYEQLEKGNVPIMIASDKDAKAYSGLFLFNPDKADEGIIEIPSLGKIFIDTKNKVRANGMMQYGLQMLIGDTVDSYRPTEISGVKFGEKSAYKILKDLTTEKLILTAVVNQYKLWYPSDFTYTTWDGVTTKSNWKHMLNLYHSCVRMKETSDDLVLAYYFYKKYGVNLNE
jgi:hypothetical protein